jgi:hypothetical protein
VQKQVPLSDNWLHEWFEKAPCCTQKMAVEQMVLRAVHLSENDRPRPSISGAMALGKIDWLDFSLWKKKKKMGQSFSS